MKNTNEKEIIATKLGMSLDNYSKRYMNTEAEKTGKSDLEETAKKSNKSWILSVLNK